MVFSRFRGSKIRRHFVKMHKKIQCFLGPRFWMEFGLFGEAFGLDVGYFFDTIPMIFLSSIWVSIFEDFGSILGGQIDQKSIKNCIQKASTFFVDFCLDF